jgi:dihydropyrimidinase
MIVGGVDDDSLAAMDRLVNDEGITSVKLFMAYPGVFLSDDAQILRAMQKAASNGSMIMMHAENGPAIDVLIAQALARHDVDPIFHGLTRPVALEEEATHRAIKLAEVAGSPVYIVHMSRGRPSSRWSRARSRANVFGETCPQYLYLNLEDHLGARLRGRSTCAPLPALEARAPPEGPLAVLRQNDLQVVSTDHCPFCFKEQKELGIGDFSKIPNGIGTVEHRMDLLYQGVVDREITLERWVDVAATTPARMFGLYPRKGIIAPGADADIVIYDPRATTRISVETHHMNMDHSAYEGTVIQGKVDTVLSRGEVIIEDGQYLGKPGHGQYLKRGLSSYLR